MDYILFHSNPKDFNLSQDDSVLFLFEQDILLEYKIRNNSYKVDAPFLYSSNIKLGKNLFENKVSITDDELRTFETKNLLQWKVILKKQKRTIIGGACGIEHYQM